MSQKLTFKGKPQLDSYCLFNTRSKRFIVPYLNPRKSEVGALMAATNPLWFCRKVKKQQFSKNPNVIIVRVDEVYTEVK